MSEKHELSKMQSADGDDGDFSVRRTDDSDSPKVQDAPLSEVRPTPRAVKPPRIPTGTCGKCGQYACECRVGPESAASSLQVGKES